MPFTDDDLARLQLLKHFKKGTGYYPKVASTKLQALVTRLKAAERIVRWADGMAPTMLMEDWARSKQDVK